jgi:hypothetical protein
VKTINPNRLKTDQRIIRGAFAMIILGILLASLFFDPENYRITECAFKNMTGVSCPGCGLTHSFHKTANLDILQGFGDHLLGPLFFSGFLVLFLVWGYESFTGKKIRLRINKFTVKTTLYSTLLVWAGYWVFRMIYGS